jgi:hypothetical protein
MKYLFVIAIACTAFACSNSSQTIDIQHQVINPHSLVYAPGVSSQNLSITHTCTCPFTWYITAITPNAALADMTGNGDNTAVAISIDRSKLTVDTLKDALQIRSIYGYDTVQVMVLK